MNESYPLYLTICNENISLLDPKKLLETEINTEKEIFSKIDNLNLSPSDDVMNRIFDFAKRS